MMKLLDFLNANTLIVNTYGLFDYDVFSNRLGMRFGGRVLRKDYTAEQIKNAAQNVIDINKGFFQAISANILNPFRTWGETDVYTAGTERTDTTTPDLTDTTSPNLTDTSTPHLTTQTQNRGNDSVKADNNNSHYVNAFNNQGEPSPESSDKGGANSTNTYNSDVTTTQNGTSTVQHTGTSTVKHTGTNTVKMVNSGADNTDKSGWNLQDYQLAMEVYINFIDIVIDYVVKDILYLTIRKEDI